MSAPLLDTRRSSSKPSRVPRACGGAALARIVELHRRICGGKAVNAESLAAALEVSSRTIKRDIDLMRDQLGVPIEWDLATRTYRYTRACDLLPLLRIDADEALALALAGKTFAAWGSSPLGRALASAMEKVAAVVGGAITLPAETIGNLLFAPDDPAADAEHRHFAFLLEAIRRRREISISYQKPRTDARPESRTLRPLQLAYLDHRWMLVAFDTSRRDMRHFILARIKDACATGCHFKPPGDFDRRRYFSGSLGCFIGRTDFDVHLRFDSTLAPYVRERPWHPSQKITDHADGSIDATLRVNHLQDLERHVLACGDHVEVFSPPELRERIARTAASLHARYTARGESNVRKTIRHGDTPRHSLHDTLPDTFRSRS